jgi:hypothetical protein
MDRGTALRRLLDDAHEALAGGDAADAERRAKALSALVRAERDVAEFVASQPSETEENAEAQRAELLGRITRLVEADRAGVPDEVLERIASGVAQS